MRIFFIALALLSTGTTHAGSCEHIRAGIELGRDTFRLNVAKIDDCKPEKNRWQKTILQEEAPASLDDPQSIESALRALIKKANEHKAETIIALAIPQLKRNAALQNTLEVIQKTEKKLSLRIAKNEDEVAKLQYMSSYRAASDRQSLIVWDIRENGMQLVRRTKKGVFEIYRTLTISSDFAQKIVATTRNEKGVENREVAVLRLGDLLNYDYTNKETHAKATLDRDYPMFVVTGKFQLAVAEAIISKRKKKDDIGYYTVDELADALDPKHTYAEPLLSQMLVVRSLLVFLGLGQSNVKYQGQIFYSPLNLADGLLYTNGEFLKEQE